MVRVLIMMTVFVFLGTACGYQMEKYQGQTSRDDIENMGMNNEVTADTENPRLQMNVGDTWGLKQDRKLIKEAAESLEGVTVRRVILEASQVWVTVDVEGVNDLTEKERAEWQSEIKQAVYSAVPRYNIHVKIKE